MSESNESYIEFDAPEGFELPEGVEVGKEFDLVATFKVKEDGEMCLQKVGGLPVKRASSQAPERSVGQGMVSAFKNRQTESENY